MDNPVYSSDIVYLWEFLLTILVTVLLTAVALYITRREERKHKARIQASDNINLSDTLVNEPPSKTQRSDHANN